MASYIGNNALRTSIYFGKNKITEIYNGDTPLLISDYIPSDNFVPDLVEFRTPNTTSLEVSFILKNINITSGTATLSNIICEAVYSTIYPGTTNIEVDINIFEEDYVNGITQTKTIEFVEGKTTYRFSLDDFNISVGSKLKNYLIQGQRWVR